MKRVYFQALSGPYMSGALVERIGLFNQRVSDWINERNALAEKLTTIVEVPETTQRTGVKSWIGAYSFGEPTVLIRAVEEIRNRRLSLPVEGLRLLEELRKLRVAAGLEWDAHMVRLKKALEDAIEAAQKEVARLKISDTAKAAHVNETTEPHRKAAAVENPCPASWVHWSEQSLESNAAILTEELQQVIHRYV